MSDARSAESAVKELPAAKVLVLGLRTHGTSEVIAGLRSLDRKEGLEPFAPRAIVVPRETDGMRSIINDFGPDVGAARVHQLTTPKRQFTLYECVNGAQAVMLAGTRACDALVWVHSADADVELDPIASMLEGALFLGAAQAFVFVTDCEEASASRLDAIERDARELLSVAGLDGDASVFVRSSAAIRAGTEQLWKQGVAALREALDERVAYAEIDESLAIDVEDVFNIRNRGVIVAGRVLRGAVRVRDEVEVLSGDRRLASQVTAIEIFRRSTESARRGDNIGLMLASLRREDIERGMLVVSVGAGVQAQLVRARCFAWRAPMQALTAGSNAPLLRGVMNQARIVSIDRAVSGAQPFEVLLELPVRQPLMLGQAMYLRDSGSLFAVCFVEEALA